MEGRAGARPEEIDDAEVVISELLAHGLLHGASRLEVQLEWRRDSPVIVMIDNGPPMDTRGEPTGVLGGVRRPAAGLFLAEKLAASLTIERTRDGNRITAVLARVR